METIDKKELRRVARYAFLNYQKASPTRLRELADVCETAGFPNMPDCLRGCAKKLDDKEESRK